MVFRMLDCFLILLYMKSQIYVTSWKTGNSISLDLSEYLEYSGAWWKRIITGGNLTRVFWVVTFMGNIFPCYVSEMVFHIFIQHLVNGKHKSFVLVRWEAQLDLLFSLYPPHCPPQNSNLQQTFCHEKNAPILCVWPRARHYPNFLF